MDISTKLFVSETHDTAFGHVTDIVDEDGFIVAKRVGVETATVMVRLWNQAGDDARLTALAADQAA